MMQIPTGFLQLTSLHGNPATGKPHSMYMKWENILVMEEQSIWQTVTLPDNGQPDEGWEQDPANVARQRKAATVTKILLPFGVEVLVAESPEQIARAIEQVFKGDLANLQKFQAGAGQLLVPTGVDPASANRLRTKS